MRFLTTVLGALALSALLLTGIGYRMGSDLPERGTGATGLTAATILGTDGAAPARGSDRS